MKVLKIVLLIGALALTLIGIYNYFQPMESIEGQSTPMITLGILVLIMSFLLKKRR